MKSLILVAALSLGTQAFANGTLVKVSRFSGFGPRVYSSVATINENGKIEKVTKTGTETKKELLKTVSPNVIQSIKDDIDQIKANDKLIDKEAGKPRCMDAPSSSVSVMKNEKEVVVANRASCHNSQMQSNAAKHLVELVQKLEL